MTDVRTGRVVAMAAADYPTGSSPISTFGGLGGVIARLLIFRVHHARTDAAFDRAVEAIARSLVASASRLEHFEEAS
jgi:hypothetical protein